MLSSVETKKVIKNAAHPLTFAWPVLSVSINFHSEKQNTHKNAQVVSTRKISVSWK